MTVGRQKAGPLEDVDMSFLNTRTARVLGVAAVAALGLGACQTYDDDFAAMNTRMDSMDANIQSASQSAQQANTAAQQANQSAQSAASEAARANQRLDTMESRISEIEQGPVRTPRG